MKVCRPDFYKEFQCIGSRCQDTCCALWEIEVDEDSAERYAGHQGPLKEDFKKYLVRREDENYFRLTEDKRCPFLNEQNLCRMILTMGEEYICDICREHPRFYHWFGDYTEVGLGLCCEEAGRFLFSRKEPLQFEVLSDEETVQEETLQEETSQAEQAPEEPEQEENPQENELWEEEPWEDDGEEDLWIELLLKAREEVIRMLQDRSCSLWDRVECLLEFADSVQPYLDEEDLEGMEAYLALWKGGSPCTADMPQEKDERRLGELLSFYEKLESLDHSWPEQMKSLQEQLPVLLKKLPAYMDAVTAAGRETDYEHLLVYFVFRYFMEAVFDSNILSPVRFAAASLWVILLLDLENWVKTGRCTLEDRIRIAKWYSKEIEYCPDNMELLTEKLEESREWL